MEDNSRSQQTGTPPDKKGIMTRNEYIDQSTDKMRLAVMLSTSGDLMQEMLLKIVNAFEDHLTETLPLQFREEEEDGQ